MPSLQVTKQTYEQSPLLVHIPMTLAVVTDWVILFSVSISNCNLLLYRARRKV